MTTVDSPRPPSPLPQRARRPLLDGAERPDSPSGWPPAGRPRRALPVHLLLPTLVLTALLIAAGVFRGQVSSSVAVLSQARWSWMPLLLLVHAVSMAAPAWNVVRLLGVAGTRVRLGDVLALTYASNAVSVSLPLVGPELATAHTYRQLVARGADTADTTWTLLVSGVASTSTLALLTVAALAVAGSPAGTTLAAGGVVAGVVPVLLLLVALRRPAARTRLEGVALRLWRGAQRTTRRPVTGSIVPLRAFLLRLAEHRLPAHQAGPVWAVALLNWLADALCLALAITAVGVPVPWRGLLLAYVAAAAAGSLRLTPGGIGVVEAALTAALVTAGLDMTAALAATVLYRLVSLWTAGTVGWAVFWATSRATATARRRCTARACTATPGRRWR